MYVELKQEQLYTDFKTAAIAKTLCKLLIKFGKKHKYKICHFSFFFLLKKYKTFNCNENKVRFKTFKMVVCCSILLEAPF